MHFMWEKQKLWSKPSLNRQKQWEKRYEIKKEYSKFQPSPILRPRVQETQQLWRFRGLIVSVLARGGGGYLTKFNMGRIHPKVQPLTLLDTILAGKVPLLYTFYWKKVPLIQP